MLRAIKPIYIFLSLTFAACLPSDKGKASTSSNQTPVKSLYGEWDVVKISKGDVEIDGTALPLEKLVISENRIQYGDEFPYLSKPFNSHNNGTILGVIIDGTENKLENEIIEIRKSLSDCRRIQSLDYVPLATEEDAGCLVYWTYATRPIAVSIDLPDHIQLTSEHNEDLRLLLKRAR